jgi:hypothetical protein
VAIRVLPTVAYMFFLWFYRVDLAKPTSPVPSKEQIKAQNDSVIQSNSTELGRIQAQLREAEQDHRYFDEPRKKQEQSSALFPDGKGRVQDDEAAHISAISEEDLRSQEEALKGQIEVYKKYNEELLQQQNEKKEGAKKLEGYMPIAVTGFLGFIALGVLLWRHGDSHAEKWAYSTFGAILGYWLKGGA